MKLISRLLPLCVMLLLSSCKAIQLYPPTNAGMAAVIYAKEAKRSAVRANVNRENKEVNLWLTGLTTTVNAKADSWLPTGQADLSVASIPSEVRTAVTSALGHDIPIESIVGSPSRPGERDAAAVIAIVNEARKLAVEARKEQAKLVTDSLAQSEWGKP